MTGCHRQVRAEQAIVCMAVTPEGHGYWLVGADGGVFSFGSARYYGGLANRRLAAPIVGMAATPDGHGYWLVGADGGVFGFGDAPYLGGMGGQRLSAPVVGISPNPGGTGYWLVAADGGVFAFGLSTYQGGMGGHPLSAPVVSMTPTPDGQGYWLAAADGGVFTYGTAPWFGSMGGRSLAAPVVGLTPTPDGRGYWLVTADGGVFTYGTARYLGSMGGRGLAAPVVGLAPTPQGSGYWLVAADGGVFTYGTATFEGSTYSARVGNVIMASIRRGGPRVAIFYYPWYSGPPRSSAWRHWNQGGHEPPGDVGSDFYPLRGAYDSSDPTVVDAQMAEIAATGVNEVVVSWWGRGSWEDQQLAELRQSTAAHGLAMAIHLEPYGGRSPASVAGDVRYLRDTYGVSDFFVYRVDESRVNEWAANRVEGVSMWATGDPDAMKAGFFEAWAAGAGFSGVYTYDGMNFSGPDFGAACGAAHAHGISCSPSVAPGFEAVRATGGPAVRTRADGGTYDAMWSGALAAGPDVITITSYNEWHEGTQIEPAQPHCIPGWCAVTYDGAWGLSGSAAGSAYLERTRWWVDRSRS